MRKTKIRYAWECNVYYLHYLLKFLHIGWRLFDCNVKLSIQTKKKSEFILYEKLTHTYINTLINRGTRINTRERLLDKLKKKKFVVGIIRCEVHVRDRNLCEELRLCVWVFDGFCPCALTLVCMCQASHRPPFHTNTYTLTSTQSLQPQIIITNISRAHSFIERNKILLEVDVRRMKDILF